MSLPTRAEQERVNRAFRAVAARLDRFETICAKNNSPLRLLVFRNSPKTEFSSLTVRYRSARRRARK